MNFVLVHATQIHVLGTKGENHQSTDFGKFMILNTEVAIPLHQTIELIKSNFNS